MLRLICVLARRTCHFVGFGMRLLIRLFFFYIVLSESLAQHWFSGYYSTCIKTVYIYVYLKFTDQTNNAIKILSQEVKGPISLCANIVDMCIPSQIICDSDHKIFDIFDIFKDRSLQRI